MTLRPEVKCNFRPFYFALQQNHFILLILTHAIQDGSVPKSVSGKNPLKFVNFKCHCKFNVLFLIVL